MRQEGGTAGAGADRAAARAGQEEGVVRGWEGVGGSSHTAEPRRFPGCKGRAISPLRPVLNPGYFSPLSAAHCHGPFEGTPEKPLTAAARLPDTSGATPRSRKPTALHALSLGHPAPRRAGRGEHFGLCFTAMAKIPPQSLCARLEAHQSVNNNSKLKKKKEEKKNLNPLEKEANPQTHCCSEDALERAGTCSSHGRGTEHSSAEDSSTVPGTEGSSRLPLTPGQPTGPAASTRRMDALFGAAPELTAGRGRSRQTHPRPADPAAPRHVPASRTAALREERHAVGSAALLPPGAPGGPAAPGLCLPRAGPGAAELPEPRRAEPLT